MSNMEKLTVIGPFTDQMKASIQRYLPQDLTLEYITQYDEYSTLKDSDYIILRTLRMDKEHIDLAEKAKLIQRWGAGFDTVDIEYAGSKGIKVGAAQGVNAQSVAELAIALILAVYRNLLPLTRDFENGVDSRVELGKRAYCLEGKTVGILGLGNIGKRVAKIVQAFGARVVYYDVFRQSVENEERLSVQYLELDEVLKTSDIVSLHLPLMDSTKEIINKDKITLMKEGAVLINTARAGLICETDLAEALHTGKLLGAGLDELNEKYNESPFANMNNVVCTPHTGGSTVDINDAMAKTCIDNIVAVRAGNDPTPFVNKVYIKK